MNQVYILNITPLSDNDTYNNFLKFEHPIRKQKAENTQNQKQRAQILGAGLCLKYAVEAHTQFEYKNLKIKFAEKNKPFVEDNPFYFSLSHSGEYAVCAISDSPIGIDIEQEGRLSEKVAKRFNISRGTEEWTEREAKGKMTGEGFFDSSENNYTFSHKKINGYIITVCSDKKTESFTEFFI